ncbi:hypothetical protein BGZ65_005489 [Modicella reniformis]|uniref:Ubiquitin-like protease family profile domain-containing protein n=1 Tax=Modicella reniformis TaxID=1440133 RepID=A0A9P6MBH4_9FUNG|nr:hypothetical protein BGZ65_005489 [Modicella reniformis]
MDLDPLRDLMESGHHSPAGVLTTSAFTIVKKQVKGIPITVPTNQRRLSHFSVKTANRALMTGYRDGGGSARRRPSTSLQGNQSSSFPPRKDDFDVIGTVPGFEKFVEAEASKHIKGKLRSPDIASLSGTDDHNERKPAKRKRIDTDSGNNETPTINPSPGESESSDPSSSAETRDKVVTSTSPPKSSSLMTSVPPNRLKHINGFRNASTVGEKANRTGAGPWPQMPLTCVRIWPTVEFTAAGMSVQFGTDRLSLTIKRNSTKIPHSEIKVVNYYTASTFKIFQFSTYGKLAESSILARYYGSTEGSVRSPMITLFIETTPSIITNVCVALKQKGIETRRLTHEGAEKILVSKNKCLSASRSSDAAEETSAKSKSIAVRADDVSRLDDGEFLNDTLIEFGLRYALLNAETKNPSLAGQVHIFNTFFYQRLVAKPAKGVSNPYEAIKNWTAKVDIFSKKYVIVPINENLHWYLAIITNPGLLIKKDDEASSAMTTGSSEPEAATSHQAVENVAADVEKRPSKNKKAKDTEMSHGSKSSHIIADEKPYILCLDSLGTAHSSVFSVLRSYLQQELLAKKGIAMNLTSKEVTGKVSSKCPKQDNLWDCGIYLLHFVEVFLRNPTALLDAVVNRIDDKALWFIPELTSKRAKYKEITNALTAQYRVYQFQRDLLDNIKGQSNDTTTKADNSTRAAAAAAAEKTDNQATETSDMDVIECIEVMEDVSDGALRKIDTES